MAQRVTISGWRCRLEWHGCSRGMRGIPLVNTSCSDGHPSLISPCPSPPLIIIMVGYSLPTPPLFFYLCFLWPRLDQGRWGWFYSRLMFTRGTTWYIIHSDTPQWANRASSDTTAYSTMASKCQQLEREVFFFLHDWPRLLLVLWECSLSDRIISG